MKRLFNNLFINLFFVFTLLFVLIMGFKLVDYYNNNCRYSIAMPTIIGQFNTDNHWIEIYGVENIINDNIATLNINETTCSIKFMQCNENRIVITGLGNQISIFPHYNEYKIKYADKDRIIFVQNFPSLSEVSGEIDLNSKTLIYTVKNAGINHNETRKIEIITDNAKIQVLEKKVISKYLRKKMFER